MSKTWKWILGIVLVLVMIGGMFAMGFFWQSRMISYGGIPRGDWDGGRPMMTNPGWQHPMFDNRDGSHPMMGGYTPFFGGFFLLGGLVKLALFFGLLYGAYWLGRRNARIALDPKPAAPVDVPAAPEAEPVPAPRKRASKSE